MNNVPFSLKFQKIKNHENNHIYKKMLISVNRLNNLSQDFKLFIGTNFFSE